MLLVLSKDCTDRTALEDSVLFELVTLSEIAAVSEEVLLVAIIGDEDELSKGSGGRLDSSSEETPSGKDDPGVITLTAFFPTGVGPVAFLFFLCFVRKENMVND